MCRCSGGNPLHRRRLPRRGCRHLHDLHFRPPVHLHEESTDDKDEHGAPCVTHDANHTVTTSAPAIAAPAFFMHLSASASISRARIESTSAQCRHAAASV